MLLLPLFLVSCVSGDISRTGEEYESRPDDWPISLYAKGTVPAEVARICQSGTPTGRQIGRIKVRGPKATEWTKILNKARSLARDIGGDEVLFTKGDHYLRWLEGRVYRRE
jgi:hypothetical protein